MRARILQDNGFAVKLFPEKADDNIFQKNAKSTNFGYYWAKQNFPHNSVLKESSDD